MGDWIGIAGLAVGVIALVATVPLNWLATYLYPKLQLRWATRNQKKSTARLMKLLDNAEEALRLHRSPADRTRVAASISISAAVAASGSVIAAVLILFSIYISRSAIEFAVLWVLASFALGVVRSAIARTLDNYILLNYAVSPFLLRSRVQEMARVAKALPDGDSKDAIVSALARTEANLDPDRALAQLEPKAEESEAA